MLIESWVKFVHKSPPNISGASQQNNLAAFSAMTEVDGHLLLSYLSSNLLSKSPGAPRSQKCECTHIYVLK